MKFDFESVLGKRVRVTMRGGQFDDDKDSCHVGLVTHVYDDSIVVNKTTTKPGTKNIRPEKNVVLWRSHIMSLDIMDNTRLITAEEMQRYKNKSLGMAFRVRYWIGCHPTVFSPKELAAQLEIKTDKDMHAMYVALYRMLGKGKIERIDYALYDGRLAKEVDAIGKRIWGGPMSG
jgi:hypothetical protein